MADFFRDDVRKLFGDEEPGACDASYAAGVRQCTVEADPTRRRLLDLLHRQSAQTLSAVYQGMDMTRQAVTQHRGGVCKH